LEVQGDRSTFTIKKKDLIFLVILMLAGSAVLVALGKSLYPEIPTEQMTSYWEAAKISVSTMKTHAKKTVQCLQK
jgi:hypothetical protein